MKLGLALSASAFSLALGACATPSTTLQNASGQAVTCSASGFGWLGAPMAMVSHADCVERMQAAGYRAVNAKSINPGLTPEAQKVRLDLPSGWEYKPAPGNLAEGLFAVNSVKDMAAFVGTVSREGVDLMAYTASRRSVQENLLVNPVSTEITRLEIEGKLALRFTTTGSLKNGLKVSYLFTIIEGRDQIAVVNTWTKAATFEQLRPELEELAGRVVGLG